MGEIPSNDLQRTELEQEELEALEQLDWRVSSATEPGQSALEVALYGTGDIIRILGDSMMRHITSHEPPEDITVILRMQDSAIRPLCYTSPEWRAFLLGVGADEFSLPTPKQKDEN